MYSWGYRVAWWMQTAKCYYKLDSPEVSKQTATLSFRNSIKLMGGLYRNISVGLFSSFCLHVVILNSFQLSLAFTGNETDRLVLLQVKARITHDPFGVMSSWNETNHFCHWHGVTCGRRHQRVTELDLRSLKLAGSISPHVGNLSFLRAIRLQNNSFSHQIPPEIGRLGRLQYLTLNNNSLDAEIPSNLSACSRLHTVLLSHNLLVGRIPEELGTLSKLRVLGVSYNNLTGRIPCSFSNLSSLEVISLNFNNFSGSIPDIFGQLTNLYWFTVEANRFSGNILPSIFNLSSITDFSVSSNNIQGTLPSNLGIAFPSLIWFAISLNQFSGTIPVSVSNASNLFYLGVSQNNLHGNVPALKKLHKLEKLNLNFNKLGSAGISDLSFLCDLANATNLLEVQLENNTFGGTLPKCATNLSSSLEFFTVAGNKISGSVPHGFGNLANLGAFVLSMNQFSGHIPPDLGRLGNLYGLYMEVNRFTGILPSSFGNLSGLNELEVTDNQLEGTIPSSLGECPNLRNLYLGNNNFSGIIPPKIIGLLSSYVILDLYGNHLSGFLPREVGKLINLERLDVSGNKLVGEIPASLGSCIKLEYLRMEGNLFRGAIPSSLASLKGIQVLSLSQNNLSGMIPEFLERFEFLHSLNLSYNNFEGKVPAKGVFKNASDTSVEGNSKLCGGISEFQLPKCKFQHPKRRGLSQTLKLVICLVCGLLGVTFSLAVVYLGCSWKEGKKQSTSSGSEKFLKVSYQRLLKATDGFSSTNLIGSGSFGSVYKGVLDEGPTTIAVKVLNLVRRGASKSFFAECEALRNIRHRNLLKVLSACSGFNYQGDDFKAIVYEFMVNGSLEEWLRPTWSPIVRLPVERPMAPCSDLSSAIKNSYVMNSNPSVSRGTETSSYHSLNGIHLRTISETNKRPRSLSFSDRLNIAIDVAMALDYLHHHCETPIVHCDLKPSNVLLNEDMVGHVGDFGLVRFIPRTSGNQSSSVGLKGTIGYAPPEYGMGHKVWTQGDVYSYGILLLEMFTGKRPTDNMFQGTSNLHNFAKGALPEQVAEIVDHVLVEENVEMEISRNDCANEDGVRVRSNIEESLISILKIGVACSAELPRERLDISDAMAEMCWVRNKLRAATL